MAIRSRCLPGTFTWTTRVNLTKAVTLRGAGVGATIIRDAVQSGNLISWTLAAGRSSRLTGIEFQNGGRTSYYTGVVTVTGSNTNGSRFRMDHCKWGENVNGSPLFDTVIGVVDHNRFIRRTGEDGHAFGFSDHTGTEVVPETVLGQRQPISAVRSFCFSRTTPSLRLIRAI